MRKPTTFLLRPMKKILTYLAFVILVASCSRNVTEKLSYEGDDYLSRNTFESSVYCKLDSISQFNTTDLDFEFTTIVYSSPDSLGNQHPVSKTTGRVTKKDSTSTISVSNGTTITQSNDSLIQVSKVKEQKDKTTEMKPYVPPWCYIIPILIVLIVASFVIVWIKKHGFY